MMNKGKKAGHGHGAFCRVSLLFFIACIAPGCTSWTHSVGLKNTYSPRDISVLEATADVGVVVPNAHNPGQSAVLMAANASLGYDFLTRGLWIRPFGFQVERLFSAGPLDIPLGVVANPAILEISDTGPTSSGQTGATLKSNVALGLSTGMLIPFDEQSFLHVRAMPQLLFRDIEGVGDVRFAMSIEVGRRKIIKLRARRSREPLKPQPYSFPAPKPGSRGY